MDPPRTRNPTRRPDPVIFPTATRHVSSSSRRTFSSSSFSSLSSCSSTSLLFPGDSPLNSPATPLRLLGVPFSWEQLPGKAKEPHNVNANLRRKNKEPITSLLPLPPHRSYYIPPPEKHRRKKSSSHHHHHHSPEKDPFTAALVECSKELDHEDDQDEQEESKALSKSNNAGDRDRFGLVNLYASCRRSCAVSESIVYLPRSTRASSYDHRLLLLHRRR